MRRHIPTSSCPVRVNASSPTARPHPPKLGTDWRHRLSDLEESQRLGRPAPVMVNFMCTGYPDIWSNIIPAVTVRGFLDKIYFESED